jgi:hypothetical protein
MQSSSQGDTFTKFPLLPKELRLKIWTYALTPRVISFHRDRDRGHFVGDRAYKFMALTTLNPSHEIIPRVCVESSAISQKRYMDWEVWDIRKNVSTTKFDPDHDVVYFSHEFARATDHLLLRDFAGQFSTQIKHIRTLALPAVFFSDAIAGMDVLKSLRPFDNLTELVIVLGYSSGQGLVGSIPGISRSVAWGERSQSETEVWMLPDGVQQALELLKRENWPDWKIPKVSVAKFLDEVLSV